MQCIVCFVMYGSIVWQYACSSHVYGSLQIAKGKKGAAGRVNCFDHCIVVVLSREDMAATYPKVVGRMVYTRADFRSWIRENEAVLICTVKRDGNAAEQSCL